MAKLVIGCGESTVDAIRAADSDPENWTLAAVLWPRHEAERQAGNGQGAWWCVLVEDVEESDLDADHATIAYREIHDFALAVGACQGVDGRDPPSRNATVKAMREAGAI